MSPLTNFPLQCMICQHLTDPAKLRCEAYPTGIPQAIHGNSHDHRTPYPNDHGIRFAPIARADEG